MSHTLDIGISGPIATIRFANPPSNFATVGLISAIADALEQVDQAAEVRVILLVADGKVFCAGADLVSENGFGANSDDPLREFYDQVVRLFHNKKPIIAVVQGAAIGAGLGLAVAADFRIASPNARFSANFVKLGFHPGFGLTHTLPRLIGQQRALEAFLSGNRYRAEEALQWGLVDRVSTDHDSLLDCALAFAQQIAENAPLGLLATRETLRGDLAREVEEAILREHSEQLKLQKTEDFAEGIRAVTERRPGHFKGQ
ncbi:enoyl-CoA hydratase/isomerase family protein [Ketobacter sp.]|uniref:enoyl-CoA hydratase/isomerase family protein n=1 Tax=Ketobacter sp. TaxID=2083498 RepID=UPI000F22889B|nr:enoyl-CoA hydratase/isomerase family protein [Ketobacter sp.]RLT95622.1 MAG: enoyl-CoA hydratase/isomerase family protein [Ketobacter sp.]